MRVSVTFRHLEADEAVKDYIREKIRRLEKYLMNPKEVHVVLSMEKFLHFAELTLVGDGKTYNSQGKDRDLYTAIDEMVEKVDRQIREKREKGRRKRTSMFFAPERKGMRERKNEEEEKVPEGNESLLNESEIT